MSVARKDVRTKRLSRLEATAATVADSSRAELLQALTRLLQLAGGSRASLLRLGFNSVMRALEQGLCEAIVLFREAPAVLIGPLQEAARLRHVPLLTLSQASAELSALLSVKSVVVLATTRRTMPGSQAVEDAASAADTDALAATLDHLRDLIADLADNRLIDNRTMTAEHRR